MEIMKSVKTKQILLVISIAVIISASLLVLAYWETSSIVITENEEQMLLEAEKLAAIYNSWITQQLTGMKYIAKLTTFDYSAEMEKILAEASKDMGFNSMSPADLNGILHLPGGRTVNLSSREYLQTLFREERAVVSDPVYSAVEGEEDMLTVLFAVPIFRDGALAGALIGQKQADFLNIQLRSINYGEGSYNFVISSSPIPIAHSNREMLEKQINPIDEAEADSRWDRFAQVTNAMIAGEKGIDQVWYDGTENFISYAPVPAVNWSIGIIKTRNAVLGTLNSLRVAMIITGLLGIAFGAVMAIIMGRTLANPIMRVAESIGVIASGSGDLTKRIELKHRKDEIGELVRSFNIFVEKLHSIVSQLKANQNNLSSVGIEMSSSSLESASAITEIQANIGNIEKQFQQQNETVNTVYNAVDLIVQSVESLKKTINNQNKHSENASSAIEEMISNIGMVNTSVQSLSDRFTTLKKSAEEGKSTQRTVSEKVNGIVSQSEELQQANKIIAGIASQTNLLAMNAAIEAAHAGDAGRGFSVVADEIRKLSETSSIQSKTIGTQLKTIQESIGSVVSSSNESDISYSSIIEGIAQVDQIVNEVSAAMTEQTEGSNQVLASLREMNESGSEVQDQTEQMNSEISRVSEAVKQLSEHSHSVTQNMEEMVRGTEQVRESATIVSDLANTTKTSIKEMEEVLGLFII